MKRLISIFTALILAAGMLAGCGTGASSDTASKSAGGQAASEASASASSASTADAATSSSTAAKDSVVIAISDEPETLDPCKGWGHGNTPVIQSTLIRYNYDMSFENDLATEYSLSDDGLVWTVKIRDDAYFTDGEKVTAEDVAFSYETAKNGQSDVDLTFMESAEAEDDTTVVITLNRPSSVFLNTIASVGIVPKHAYGDDYGINPIGSGPFKFVEWDQQEKLVLEANEDYYGEVPAIKHVTIVFMGEDASLAAVKAGQVDVALTSATVGGADVEGYTLQSVSSVDNRGLTLPVLPDKGEKTEDGYPVGNNVTCNIEIRQAIAYVIDREMIANTVLNGFARPAYSENDGMPWNNPETAIETDVEYAKKMLSDAGWEDTNGNGTIDKDGVEAEFTCVYPGSETVRQAVALSAASQMEQIGIKMNVEGTSWDDITTRMFSSAVLMGWGAANPYESYLLYYSTGALKTDYYNPEGYMNDTTDGYLSAAMEALTTDEAYENWKLAQWDGKTGTAMQGECPWVWLVNLDHLYYVRDGLNIGVQQLHPHGSSMPLLQNLLNWKWE